MCAYVGRLGLNSTTFIFDSLIHVNGFKSWLENLVKWVFLAVVLSQVIPK